MSIGIGSGIVDVGTFFRSTLTSSINTSINHRRVPFTFTSTARLIKSGGIKHVSDVKLAAATTLNRQRTQLALIERDARGTATAAQLGLGGFINVANSIDTAIAATSKATGVEPSGIIRMAINPESMQFSQAKRISRRDTMEGSIFYHFTNSADQNNDILEVTFSGQTGNINTRVDPISMISTGAPEKLRRWHDLYNLTREGMLLNETNTGVSNIRRGIPNQFFVTYRTLLFPVQITLVGFFSKVLDFTESADSPNSTRYSMQFTVTDTFPKLDDIAKQLSTAVVLGTATDVARAPIAALSGSAVSAINNL